MTSYRHHSKSAHLLDTLTAWTDYIAADRALPIHLDTIPTLASRRGVYPSTVYRWWESGRLPRYLANPAGSPLFLTTPTDWQADFVREYSSRGYMVYAPSDISALTGVSASRLIAMLDAHPERYRSLFLISRGTRLTPAWLLAPRHPSDLRSMGLTRDAN